MSGAWLLDVGNSGVKLAAKSGQSYKFIKSFDFDVSGSAVVSQLVDIVESQNTWQIWICCSNPSYRQALVQSLHPLGGLFFAEASQLPIVISTEGTGVDRLLSAWSVWERLRTNVFVLDVGTAWTLDIVTYDGEFLGGAIGLPPWSQRRELLRLCPHLPCSVSPVLSEGGVPRRSVDAVNAGVWQSFIRGIDCLVDEWKLQASSSLANAPLSFVLSGGGGCDLSSLLRDSWEYRPHLVLDGLVQLIELESAV